MTLVASSPKTFSIDEHCTFDLKFCESEKDECASQCTDLFGRSQSPSDDLLLHIEDNCQTHKKRKMEVTPASPDKPRTSPQLVEQQQQPHTSGFEQKRSQSPERLRRFSSTQDGMGSLSSSDDASLSKYDSADDLFQGVAQRTKMLILQMAQNFKESEEFENLSLHKVEALLKEAYVLEGALRQHKDVLQQRLFVIGRSLDD